MDTPSVEKTKAYGTFGRCVDGWEVFKRAATEAEAHWLKDLLSLWKPSGHPSGDDGLRLAVRDGYLNFYRRGQSVARVYCLGKELVAEVHYKYVGVEPQPGMSKAPYLRLTGKNVSFRDMNVATYEGHSTLQRWIHAANTYVGVEKSIVDQLVERNDQVIDLEMAIPAWKEPRVAVRMDLVALENGKVIFWEAKTVDDSRIRCNAEFEVDKFPHVLKQLSEYRTFLDQAEHRELVGSAYQATAEWLVRLRELADKVGPTLLLGPSIIAASKGDKLEVERQAVLVVVDLEKNPKGTAWTSWKKSHESKLTGKIPMLVLEKPGRLEFEGAK